MSEMKNYRDLQVPIETFDGMKHALSGHENQPDLIDTTGISIEEFRLVAADSVVTTVATWVILIKEFRHDEFVSDSI